MTTDLESLKDLLDEGSKIVQAAENEEKRLKVEAWNKTLQSWFFLWPKINAKIPNSLTGCLLVSESDISDLILTGRSTGMHFEFNKLFPIYLSVNHFKEDLTVEFFVPAMVKVPQGFRAALPDDDDPYVWANEIRLQFEDMPLAVYWAKRRFDLMQELQAKFDAERKQPEYVKVEETQGTQSNVLGITFDCGPLQSYIDERIRLVTQFLGQ